jgi:broad specificity phosphatase PhoE
MQDTDIYLVRHGQAQCNLDRIVTGQTESPLSDIGRLETQKLKEKLKSVHFDTVVSSDLGRAVETARILVDASDDIRQFPELRERSFGALEGRPDSILKPLLNAHAKLTPTQQWKTPLGEGVESDEHVYERAMPRIEKLVKDNAGKKILIVTHGGPIRALLIGLGFYSESELPLGSFKHGGFVHLCYGGHDFELLDIDGVGRNHLSSE